MAPGASGLLALALALALAPAPRPLAAQEPGTWAADRARLAELLGRTTPRDTATHDGWRLVPVLPTVRLVWNSDLPHSLNDGPLWAGRGLSTSVTGGVGATGTIGGWRVRAVLGPTVVASANRPFQVIPGADPARSSFSSPWHVGQASADLPLRMGDRSLLVLDPGTSTLAVSRGAVEVGATTSPEWWGPGIRNALVLSTNGPGVPRLYLGTARPVRTAVGAVEARLLAGTLTESLFFDSLAANDYRSLSGFLVTLRPAGEPGLTLGLARVAVAPIAGAGGSLSHALDALVRWESIAAPDDTLADGRSRQRVDQVLSLFGRWVVPHGLEVYGEWARMELPRSLREWLTAPQSTQGYTLGLQWARPMRDTATMVRLQGEVSYVEQSALDPLRDVPDFYTGRATAHGFTQRGQLLGAAIGPGGSSQWIAGDWLRPGWQAGLFAGRIRWENDALYRQRFPTPTRHDVTLFAGARGGHVVGPFDVTGELTVSNRINYLFQNLAPNPDTRTAVDVRNVTLGLMLAPRR